MSATTTTDFSSALTAAVEGGYVARLNGGTYTISSPIVIRVNSTIQGALGIDGGGATLISQVTNGQPLIRIIVEDLGIDFRYLSLSNFNIVGNGSEGDGIQIVCPLNDSWIYNFAISDVTIEHVGGYGLSLLGSVFEGIVSNSWMNDNALGGAYFAHRAEGGQVSALRWFGGGAENNGGAGITLDNGARDLSVNGATFSGNGGDGISASMGITSVSNSLFEDNLGHGVWFQNFGNFTGNTFSTSGVQASGISGYLAGHAALVDNTSIYTGVGANPTTLANLQGNGGVFVAGDNARVVTGPGLVVSSTTGGNLANVTVGTHGVAAPEHAAVTGDTTTARADSNGTGAVESALKAAVASNSVVTRTDTDVYTVTSPIVINLTQSVSGPIGIDLGGAKIWSMITDGSPVIEIIVGAGVDIGSLTLSNFSISGNSFEGDGIKIVVDGTHRSIRDLTLRNVNVEHVGGIGLDVLGNVSKGTVFNSWMHGNDQGGARFANSAGGGIVGPFEWVGGGFRKNDVAGLILDSGTRDLTVDGAYIVDNYGPGILATSGIALVTRTGFENNRGVGAFVDGSATFVDTTFATYGTQTVAIGGWLAGGQINLVSVGNEYYGWGADPTVLANVQGTGTLSIVGGGNVVVGPNVSVTGGDATDWAAPCMTSIAIYGSAISGGSGTLNAGDTVTFALTLSETVTVAGGTPILLLNDGGTATYAGGSGGTTLTFVHTVQAGQNASDLAISAVSLNGAIIEDAAGIAANLAGAANCNPTGTLKIDTAKPTVQSITASGNGISAGSGTVGVGGVITLTVTMNEAVTVSGMPTLALSDGGTATYVGGSGTKSLTFRHTVSAGQATPELAVTSFDLNGGSIKDAAGNAAKLAGASGYNLAGTLEVGSTPVLTAKLIEDSGTSSADKVTAHAALTGTATPGAVVHFAIDGVPLAATAIANAKGIWSFTPIGLADGVHRVVASETNAAGTGSASIKFTLDTQGPVPVFTGGSLANGQVILTGSTGEAGNTVEIYDGYTWLGFATTGSDGRFIFTATADPSVVHGYGANAFDSAGNTGHGIGGLLVGSGGGDVLKGGSGTDRLDGGDGNDVLTGGAGADRLIGRGGADRAEYSDAASGVTADLASPGTNTGIAAGDTYSSIENLFGSAYGDALRGDAGANKLWGADGSDILEGRGGADMLTGGDGIDTLNGGDGDDKLIGGVGADGLIGGCRRGSC